MTLISPSEVEAGVGADVAPIPAAGRRRFASRTRRILSSLIGAVVVLWGTATAAFFAQRAIPGDLATAILNIQTGQAQQRTASELAPIVKQFGLNNPLVVQYLQYLGGLLHGDLGTSYQQYRPVWQVIGEQMGSTLVLTLTAIVFSWVLMIVWVTLTAGRGPRLRALGSSVDTLVAGLPPYWLGIFLLLVFAADLHWFPVLGGTSPAAIVLPALTLAIPLAGFMGQATRTEFERALDQPFALTARTRGMGDLELRLRHVLRHAAIPAVTLTGWALGATISGAVIVESIFSRPGIGTILVTAVNSRDLPVVTGVVVVVAFVYVVANVIVDVAYTLLDPRLKTIS